MAASSFYAPTFCDSFDISCTMVLSLNHNTSLNNNMYAGNVKIYAVKVILSLAPSSLQCYRATFQRVNENA
jgi:hypothetical protein